MQALVDEFKRKFLSSTARSQGQSIGYFRDPFKLIPPTQLPDMVDKFKRNAVMTSNEWRQILMMMPSDNPDADRLENPNISKSKEQIAMQNGEITQPEGETGLESLLEGGGELLPETKDDLASFLDELEQKLSEVVQ